MRKVFAILLVMILCLGLWACGENSDNIGAGVETNNNTTNRDPNGFSSMEDVVDVYFRLRSGELVTEYEMKRIYPQEIWDNWENYIDKPLEDSYADYLDNCDDLQSKYSQKYGENYEIQYSIRGAEKEEKEVSFSQEDIDYAYKVYGAHPSDCAIYRVSLDISLKGSLREETLTDYTIIVRKIGDKWYGY